MSKARLIITAVVVEGRTKSEVARDYEVSRYWVQQLVQRYARRGRGRLRAALATTPYQPARGAGRGGGRDRPAPQGAVPAGTGRRRRHHPHPPGPSHPEVADRDVAAPVPAVSTIWRILTRRGFVTPQPHKRPRSSWHRFAAEQPNERWQADTTHWQLADGTEVEILNILDDHSRLALASVPRRTITGPDVSPRFQEAFLRWGIPASVLTDNGAVFTGKQRRGGRVALEVELGRLGIRFDHSRALPPPDLRQGGAVPADREEVARRPTPGQDHRRRCTASSPGSAATTTSPAPPGPRPRRPPGRPTPPAPRPPPPAPTSTRHCRVRHDRVDKGGTVTLRYNSRLHHIGIGRRLAGTRGHPARRRPPHPGHRPLHRRTPPRADPGPHPRLPTPRSPTRHHPKRALK